MSRLTSTTKNSKGQHVEDIQRLLNQHGADLKIDGIFGSKTEAAVMKFQKHYRLQVDGIVGPKTMAALVGRSDPDMGSNSSMPNLVSLRHNPKGDHVKTIQRLLNRHGAGIGVDGIFGPQTDAAVRNFQSRRGLAVDGVVGPNTRAALAGNGGGNGSMPNLVSLRHNPRGAHVEEIQRLLNRHGAGIGVDGIFGPQTDAAVRSFQSRKGLTVDGVVGPNTRAALNGSGGGGEFRYIPGRPGSKSAQELIRIAESFVGVRERGGNNRGPEVEMFQRTIGGAAGEAWCMSFVQYCIKQAEAATGARSGIHRSEGCQNVWYNSPSNMRRSRPEPGSVVIWGRRNSWQGHTGVVVKVHANGSFETVEGNTSGGAGVNRSGDGVYRCTRHMGGYGSLRVMGFLKVF